METGYSCVALIFESIGWTPYLDTMCPGYSILCQNRWHLCGFSFSPCSSRHLSACSTLFWCSSKVAKKIMMSSSRDISVHHILYHHHTFLFHSLAPYFNICLHHAQSLWWVSCLQLSRAPIGTMGCVPLRVEVAPLLSCLSPSCWLHQDLKRVSSFGRQHKRFTDHGSVFFKTLQMSYGHNYSNPIGFSTFYHQD